MIEDDLVECVIALGKNLFYNSIMESCLLITNNNKPSERKGKILFIDAREELKREKTISYLIPEHIDRIYSAYIDFKTVEGFSYVADISEVVEKEANLNIPLYIKSQNKEIYDANEAYAFWEEKSDELMKSMQNLFEVL